MGLGVGVGVRGRGVSGHLELRHGAEERAVVVVGPLHLVRVRVGVGVRLPRSGR